MDGRAPPTRQPERGWASPAAGGRGRRGCPDAGHAIGRLSASAVRRADVCPLGRADVRCPRDRCPRDRRDPGVRTDTPPVTVAPASALSAQRWILACVGAAGPPTSGRVGCDMSRWLASGWVVAAPNWGLAGKGWSWVRLCLAPTGSTADRPPVWIRGGCGVALAAGPTWELVQRRVPVGWLGARAGAAAHMSPCRCVLDRLPV
jgi:hypothetical protein